MIFGSFERMVALRYLRARRQEGFISVIAGFSLLGIALGVATLIIVMSVMNGFRAELLSRILGLSGHAAIHGREAPIRDYDRLVQRLAGIEGVTAVTPQIEGQVMATAGGVAAGALVQGVRPTDLRARTIVSDNLVEGSLARFADGRGILLGSRLALRLGVGAGDKVTLISPTSAETVIGSVPRMRAYRVAALFNVGMFEYDNSFIYMPLAVAQTFFGSGRAVNAVEIRLADPDAVARLRAPLARAAGPDHRVTDWQQRNASFFNALQVERNVMFLILTLIILVAAFNIISSMIMLVKDKGRDIAVLRTMGASKGMVLRVFLLAGAGIGVIGTLAGAVLGLLFALNIETVRQWIQGLTGAELFSAEIYFLSRLPAKVDPVEVAAVIAMALFLSFAATLYPSWRAARIEPAEALRYE